VPSIRLLFRKSSLKRIALIAALLLVMPRLAYAEASLLIDAHSGKVLEAENATYPWHPASLTKLMTAYVTLEAVKNGKMTLDTLLTVSRTAASQAPVKMGFPPGTKVTVDNALKMMLVKSANDMAVVLAEGVGGSIDAFCAMMNQTAQKLGMTQTSYVNPNGLPADGQITSARDMAILARAFIRDLPQYEYFVHIPAIRFGRAVIHNYNPLIGRYPGADGFKTGFICAAGFNIVASATQNGRRLIAVVLGASSSKMRAVKAAELLDRGFATNPLSWLQPSLGNVKDLVPVEASPPDLRAEICGGKHKPPSEEDDEAFGSGLPPETGNPAALLAKPRAPSEPVLVYTGPAQTGAGVAAAVAADAKRQAAQAARYRARRHIAAKKRGKVERGKTRGRSKLAKSRARTGIRRVTKPASVRHVSANTAGAAKPAVAAVAAGRRTIRHARATKPRARIKSAKSARKSTSAEGRPAG
jgi:D-alanyl-D-alanine carboxypeptidase